MTEEIQNLMELFHSKDKSNHQLAFEISKGLNLYLPNLNPSKDSYVTQHLLESTKYGYLSLSSPKRVAKNITIGKDGYIKNKFTKLEWKYNHILQDKTVYTTAILDDKYRLDVKVKFFLSFLRENKNASKVMTGIFHLSEINNYREVKIHSYGSPSSIKYLKSTFNELKNIRKSKEEYKKIKRIQRKDLVIGNTYKDNRGGYCIYIGKCKGVNHKGRIMDSKYSNPKEGHTFLVLEGSSSHTFKKWAITDTFVETEQELLNLFCHLSKKSKYDLDGYYAKQNYLYGLFRVKINHLNPIEEIKQLPNYSSVIKKYIQNIIDSGINPSLIKDFTSLEFLDNLK